MLRLLASAQVAPCIIEGEGVSDSVCWLQKQPAEFSRTARSSLSALEMNSSLTIAFEAFMRTHGRTYKLGSTEFDQRRLIFAKAWADVQAQNAKANRLWTAGINQFSDRVQEEMKEFYGWRPRPLGGILPRSMGLLQREQKGDDRATQLVDDTPEEKSWSLWATSPKRVRRQGCGNCWAAATVQMLEAHYELWRHQNRTFSLSELTNCTPNPFACGGTGGCNGATVELALGHVMLNGLGDDEYNEKCPENMISPVDANEAAPHEAQPGKYDAAAHAASTKFGMIGWMRLPENKYVPLKRALVEHGPVAVSVATGWSHYAGGIYDSCQRGGVLGHAMLLVGYGHDEGKEGDPKYWRLQNSWGNSWGDHGFIKLLRRDDEETYCGEDRDPRSGTGCNDGLESAESVNICGMCGILYDNVVPIFKEPDAAHPETPGI